MTLLEKIWILTSFLIIFLILSMDPKASIAGTWSTQLSTIFGSTSEGQNFIKQLNWILIIVFFLLTISLNYFV